MQKDPCSAMQRLQANGSGCLLVTLPHCRASEHAHSDLQISVPFFRSIFTARWHTEAGRSRQRTVCAGECCIVPSGQPHRFHWEEAAEMVNLYLDAAWLERAADEARGRSGWQIVPDYGCQDPVLWQLGQAVHETYHLSAGPSRLLLEGAAAVAAMRVLRSKATNRSASSRPSKLTAGSLRRATDYVQEHLDVNIGLVDLAAAAGYSPFHFARAFKEATGLPPHRYVVRERLERAKRRLCESHWPVGQIGLDCGFINENHFVRVFRRAFGRTPHRYRLEMGRGKFAAKMA